MTGHPSPSDRHQRNERGAVLPSPVVWLSIIAVAVAAVAFVTTRDAEPEERQIRSAASADESTPTQTPQDDDEVASPTDEPTDTETDSEEPEEPEKTKKPVDRADHGVVVFNNTSIAGLASEVLAQVEEIGWQAVAADNWYGTIPATTVYFPRGQRDAAQMLALDLGIQRLVPADPAMSETNLTVILTGALE